MSSSKFVPLRVILGVILLLATICRGERFCGPKLTDTLELLCRSRYASLAYRNDKRSGGDDFMDEINDESVTYPRMYQSYPFASLFGSTSALGTRVRSDFTGIGKRGVIDECCIKPCSISVLMTYCGA